MSELEDTQAFTPVFDDEDFPEQYNTLVPTDPEAPWVKFTAAGEPENEIEEQLPKPALVRAILITGVSLVGALFGKTFNVEWVDAALDLYMILAPVVLGFWIRHKVKPS